MVCEAWRFPVVDSHYDGVSVESSYAYNDVTFVYDGAGLPTESVEVVGSFGDLFAPVPRAQCDSSVRTPASTRDAESAQGAGAHLQVRGRRALPARSGEPAAIGCRQRTTLVAVFHRCLPGATGAEPPGARGARQAGHTPASVPPGREPAVYPGGLHKLDRAGRGEEFPLGYRLDEEVGTVNYIDKVLARPPEQHNADDYHTCLPIIDGLLRARAGGKDPLQLPIEDYAQLYGEMATDQVEEGLVVHVRRHD